MASVNVNLSCDLQHPVRVQYLDGNMFSMDNGGNTINVLVYDNGEPAQIGGTVTANVIRADGGTVAVTGSLSGNKVTIVMPQACYAVTGAVSVIIKLTQDTTVTTIAAFVANVYRSSTDTVVDPGTIIQSVEDLIADIEGAVADIPVAYNASFAPAYSNSSTYAVGQYVTYDGYLWRCTAAITTAESWTSGHWTKVALAEELSDVKRAFVATIGMDNAPIPFELDGTGYINQNTGDVGATSNYYHTDYIPVSDFSKLAYKRVGVTQSSSTVAVGGMAFYSEQSVESYVSGVQALRSQSALGYVSELYTVAVPATAKYVRFSVLPSGTYGDFAVYGESKLLANTKNLRTPEMYGAIGDGVADDSSAFVNALSGDGVVLIGNRSKTYLVKQTLTLNNNASLLNMHILEETSGLITANEKENITIKNCKVRSSGAYNSTKELLSFTDCTNVTLENIDIAITNASANIVFDGCSNVICRSINMPTYYETGIRCENETSGILIEGCNIANCASSEEYNYAIAAYAVYGSAVTTTARNIVIKNNTITDYAWTAIDTHGGFDIHVCQNKIRSISHRPDIAINIGDRTRAQQNHVIVSENIIYGNNNANAYAISLSGVEEAIISKNLISNWSSVETTHEIMPYVFYERDAKKIRISENLIESINCGLLYANGGEDIDFSGNNAFYNTSGTTYYNETVFKGTAAKFVSIRSNYIFGYAWDLGGISISREYRAYPYVKDNILSPKVLTNTSKYITSLEIDSIEDFKYTSQTIAGLIYGNVNDTVYTKDANNDIHIYVCISPYVSENVPAVWRQVS